MIHYFKDKDNGITLGENQLPSKFTYPFQYTPHPLVVRAANQVNEYLQTRTDWQEELSHGKMFGVLLVENPSCDKSDERVGFLAAFSGNLAGSNHHAYFVPPVFDLLRPGDFFKVEESNISAINQRIQEITTSPVYKEIKESVRSIRESAETQLKEAKTRLKEAKQLRDKERNEITDRLQLFNQIGNQTESDTLSKLPTDSLQKDEFRLKELIKESQFQKAEYKRLEKKLKEETAQKEAELRSLDDEISALKQERKARSAALQMKLFEHFILLNAQGETKNLCQIFEEVRQSIPPAGAGECALPKLLQYAYLHQLKPLAFGEFWWGESPKDEIRHHGQFYPSCKGKCEPILQHMLVGLNVESNPLISEKPDDTSLKIIYEDQWIVAIEKPAGMLSTPGKEVTDSVSERLRLRYPEATGPLLVHRLDMATSGLLLAAKTKEVHAQIQALFEAREVRKLYTAILDGIPAEKEGTIHLPLCLNPMDRPRQMVSYEHGKEAITHYKVIETQGNNSLVVFDLQTGRTHQIRMHAAHPLGLNCPIKGDDLYGTHADRLYLHATEVEFVHPVTRQRLVLRSEVPFITSHKS